MTAPPLLVALLASALSVAPFDLMPAPRALEHGFAMALASSPEVPAAELAAIMRHESGGWLDARPGMRHWPHDARRFPRLRSYVCGLMQVAARTPSECVSWINNPAAAYRAGADVLRAWHRHCSRIGRRGERRHRCAAAGYAKGTAAARLAS